MTQAQLASELISHGIGAELAYAILEEPDGWTEEDLLALLEEGEFPQE